MTHYSPIKKPVRSDISLRMSLYAVIISLFFAAISVVLLIYIESNQAERELIRKTSQIVDTIEQQIGQYLWDIDDNGIQTTLQRVVELPYIKGASIETGLGNSFYIGDQSTPEKISRDIFLYE